MASAQDGHRAGAGHVVLHAIVLSWPGWEDAGREIARALHGHVDHLTVLHKSENVNVENGYGEWHRVPGNWYFGKQCELSFELFRGDVLLQIQADVHGRDWPLLASRCRAAFRSSPAVGIWAPDIFYCAHPPEVTSLAPRGREELIAVSRTDGIVWALGRPVVARLSALDYEVNNLGWGIDDAAAAFARSCELRVVVDASCKLEHPRGSSYSHGEALRQRRAFIGQLSEPDLAYVNWMEEDERRRRTLLYRWRRNLRLLAMNTRRLLRLVAAASSPKSAGRSRGALRNRDCQG